MEIIPWLFHQFDCLIMVATVIVRPIVVFVVGCCGCGGGDMVAVALLLFFTPLTQTHLLNINMNIRVVYSMVKYVSRY